MSDFTAIGQMVTEARNLLDSIKGGAIRTMQTQFDALKQTFSTDTQQALSNFQNVSNAKIAQQDQALKNAVAPILDKVTVLALTKNQTMDVITGSIPDGFMVNGGVTMELIERISGCPRDRSGYQMQILSEMKSGVKLDFPDFNIREQQYFFRSFNVFRVSWDFPDPFDGSEWLIFPSFSGGNAVNNRPTPISGAGCDAAFVKLESGSLYGGFAAGAKEGKWCFTRQQRESTSFGNYVHPHPVATSRQGSMLVALPVTASGFIDHPHKLFALPELG
ncbi:hypothetical protein [Vibrio caribbeanicus]|uniref:Uncharacterized protein n=1 Tax=Vibrio caribbeanicus ATCC BAA-2122 TaxID=796620 RepID=E3BHZ6_9VIBR|nr:hypothetical protein [Vibrio caribbeanicus]EFP97435.1 hypothetical protein VIBC2010_18629 [Vibrio caribbeanicus ATCC BAA-2122]